MNEPSSTPPSNRPLSIWVRTHWPILALLGVLLVAGLSTVTAYGLSWDEGRNLRVGEGALAAYTGSAAYFAQPSIDEHGPIYFMVFSLTGKLAQQALPGWTAADGRHMTNFVTFCLGVLLLYLLCLRFMKPKSAWFTAALFASQPVIFGHGFVNQKDIPFMTSFIASVLVGMSAVDSLAARGAPSGRRSTAENPLSARGLTASLKREWEARSIVLRLAAIFLCLCALILVVDLLVTHTIRDAMESALVAAYHGEAATPIQWLFSKVATDAYKTPLSIYMDKFIQAYSGYSGVFSVLLLLVPAFTLSALLPSLAIRWGFGRRAVNGPLLAASVLLGVTICIRQVGLFAVALVGLYMFLKLRERALFPALLVTIISAFVTWATWPYLWSNPPGNFASSVLLASDFPSRAALFEGVSYGSQQLPWTFFPVMASIELTEPAVGLILLGLLVGLWRTWKRQVASVASAAVLGTWIAVPLGLLFFSRMSAYGNIRQLLFLLPAMFVLAGLSVELLLRWVARRWAKALLMTALLLPGLVGIVQLFPYEYIYFNSLAGGVNGAVGRFELDRWCLSSRAAIGVLNEIAPPGATVIVPIQTDQVAPFARPDLQLSSDLPMYPEADFVISCTYRSYGDWHTTAYKDVYNITRGKAILTSIWKRAESP